MLCKPVPLCYCSISAAGVTCEDFLSTVRGAPYATMFRGLRTQHLVNDLASVKILELDHIIPMGELWLLALMHSDIRLAVVRGRERERGGHQLPVSSTDHRQVNLCCVHIFIHSVTAQLQLILSIDTYYSIKVFTGVDTYKCFTSSTPFQNVFLNFISFVPCDLLFS